MDRSILKSGVEGIVRPSLGCPGMEKAQSRAGLSLSLRADFVTYLTKSVLVDSKLSTRRLYEKHFVPEGEDVWLLGAWGGARGDWALGAGI